jgi:hypothetical protein
MTPVPAHFLTGQIATRRARVRRYERVRRQLIADQGNDPSEAQSTIAKNAAGLAIWCEDQVAKLINNKPVDIGELSTVMNTLRRLLETLGIHRAPRDVTTLSEYLAKRAQPVINGSANESIEAIDDKALFKTYFRDPATWKAWRAALCALFGLPMSDDELETFQKCTGRTRWPEKQSNEAWFICGRRGGKSFTLALIAVYLATFKDWQPFLTTGERGHIIVVAADRKQARVIFSYIRSLITETPMLAEMLTRETTEEIELNNRISIEVATCSYRTIRGRTIVAALCDELAFWQAENSSNPDEEVLAAIRPAMATIPGSMLLCASSPYARRGALWDAHAKWYGVEDAPVLVWRASTQTMNPTVSDFFIQEAYERDPASAAAEYGAEFRTDVERLLTREAVMACVNEGVFERPHERKNNYIAFADPSGGSNDAFTLAIGHKENKTCVLDLLRERNPPFSPEAVISEYAAILKKYRLSSVYGDKYAGEFVAELFRKNGINYMPSERSKSEIYIDTVPAINSGALALLDNNKLIAQLIGLERRARAGGRDTIDHCPGGHDDLCNSAAGALTLTDKAAPANFNRRIEYPDRKAMGFA